MNPLLVAALILVGVFWCGWLSRSAYQYHRRPDVIPRFVNYDHRSLIAQRALLEFAVKIGRQRPPTALDQAYLADSATFPPHTRGERS